MKAIIFDQDGTLYPEQSSLTDELRRRTKDWIIANTTIPSANIEKCYRSLAKAFPNPYDGFASLGLRIEDYLSTVFDNTDPAAHLDMDDKLVRILKDLKMPKYVVTFSSHGYAQRLQNSLGVLKHIEKTMCMQNYQNHSKESAYLDICNRNEFQPNEVCVIGNNFDTDIAPALKYKFATILVGHDDERTNCVPTIYDIKRVLMLTEWCRNF